MPKNKDKMTSRPPQAHEVKDPDPDASGAQLRVHPLDVWDAGSTDIREALASLAKKH